MADDKDAARRRRQARNRQERLNRQTRVEGAKRSAARPARTADKPPATSGKSASRSTTASSSSSSSRTAATAASGGMLSKLFPPRAAPMPKGAGGRPPRAQPVRDDVDEDVAESSREENVQRSQSGRPVRRQPTHSVVVELDEDAPGPRGAVLRAAAQPGGRATMFAAAVAVMSGILLLVVPVPREALTYYGGSVIRASSGSTAEIAKELNRYADVSRADRPSTSGYAITFLSPFAIFMLTAIPIAIAAFALRGLRKPNRSRTLLIAAGVSALYAFLSGPQISIISTMALGFAAYQSRKADQVLATEVADDDQ